MSQYKPTPFEIVSVASLLALRAIKSRPTPIENWFPSAKKLLLLASAQSQLPTEDQVNKWVLDIHPYRSFPFAEVLKQSPPPVGRKKGLTMLGPITTRKGLAIAIRCVFLHNSQEILERGSLFKIEIEEIIRDQSKRAARRSKAGQ